MSSSRCRWGWYLYDFADAILIFNGVLYFPKWIVIGSGAGEFSYNLAIALTTILLVVSNPVAGLLSDVKYGRLLFLRLAQYAVGGGALLIIVSGIAFPPGPARTLLALGAFAILMYGHQASSAFYNALLPAVAESTRTYADVAGTGFAFRRAGALAGVLATLPIATIHLSDTGPPAPFLVATLLYIVLTTVALRMMPDEPHAGGARGRLRGSAVFETLRHDFACLCGDRRVLIFLVASLVFMDAILTVEANVTLYMDRVMHLGESAKAFLLVLLLATSALGAKACGPLVARCGLRASFTTILLCGTLALAGVATVRGAPAFAALLAIVGAAYGAVSTCARATYLILIPADRRAEYLALYGSFERCASVTGPLAWGAIVGLLGIDSGYRVAMLAMAALVAVSIPLVRAVNFAPSSGDVPGRALDLCESV
jgi:UMF1 family MFS transporter